jgi:hypothetical protein
MIDYSPEKAGGGGFAFVRSEDIVSASGPRLVIQDSFNNQSLGNSDDSLGTPGWRQQVVDFVTGPETRLIASFHPRYPRRRYNSRAPWKMNITCLFWNCCACADGIRWIR